MRALYSFRPIGVEAGDVFGEGVEEYTCARARFGRAADCFAGRCGVAWEACGGSARPSLVVGSRPAVLAAIVWALAHRCLGPRPAKHAGKGRTLLPPLSVERQRRAPIERQRTTRGVTTSEPRAQSPESEATEWSRERSHHKRGHHKRGHHKRGHHKRSHERSHPQWSHERRHPKAKSPKVESPKRSHQSGVTKAESPKWSHQKRRQPRTAFAVAFRRPRPKSSDHKCPHDRSGDRGPRTRDPRRSRVAAASPTSDATAPCEAVDSPAKARPGADVFVRAIARGQSQPINSSTHRSIHGSIDPSLQHRSPHRNEKRPGKCRASYRREPSRCLRADSSGSRPSPPASWPSQCPRPAWL